MRKLIITMARMKKGLVMKDKFKTLAVTGQSSIQMKSAYKLLSAMVIFWARDFSNFVSISKQIFRIICT